MLSRPIQPSACATFAAAAVLVFGMMSPGPAHASQSWAGIRAEAFAGKTFHDGVGVVTLNAPYRPDDVRSVPLEAEVSLGQGRTIKSISFVVDENPSPVAAVFRVGEARAHAKFGVHIRLDQQSDVRVIVEASDGQFYMAERLVKFAGGQASCSAPPMGDPADILANTGKMDFAAIGDVPTGSHQTARARYTLNHPNHTGMVLDQITLLYVPLLMVDHIEARQGDDLVFEMTGSITIAQNPLVEFDYVTNGATEMTVTARDTGGASWTRRFPIGLAG